MSSPSGPQKSTSANGCFVMVVKDGEGSYRRSSVDEVIARVLLFSSLWAGGRVKDGSVGV